MPDLAASVVGRGFPGIEADRFAVIVDDVLVGRVPTRDRQGSARDGEDGEGDEPLDGHEEGATIRPGLIRMNGRPHEIGEGVPWIRMDPPGEEPRGLIDGHDLVGRDPAECSPFRSLPLEPQSGPVRPHDLVDVNPFAAPRDGLLIVAEDEVAGLLHDPRTRSRLRTPAGQALARAGAGIANASTIPTAIAPRRIA